MTILIVNTYYTYQELINILVNDQSINKSLNFQAIF